VSLYRSSEEFVVVVVDDDGVAELWELI